MKRLLIFSLVLLGVLFLGGQANATVVYNHESLLAVSFSIPWNDTSVVFVESAVSSGRAYADYFAGYGYNADKTNANVLAHALGEAGDATATLNGTAQSSMKTTFNIIYNFDAPTDLTVTLIASDLDPNVTLDFFGMESYNYNLQNMFLWNGDNRINDIIVGSHVFTGLTGENIFSLVTIAEGGASTSYPAPVPEASAILLLGSGLVGLVGFRRRMRMR